MTLAAGARLGPYEIGERLGAGGMGEVYRARDSRLDRPVAVKVLPAHLAEHREALGRLEREAKAVAALSHPNILAIHDFGNEGGTAYAVMELLEGETLRQRLAAGALPLRTALDWAGQIALGLAAAHDKGIVHRDLKPENLFVTRDGRVKILDFGLARLAPGPTDDSHSPTRTGYTEPGTVLGTVGYMSPEQVRGEVADHRSDVFAFGCLLYEMLTGRRAFQRDTAAETMTAVLREDPDLARSDTPPMGVVRHCLGKSPADRFQSIRDVAFALESLATTGPGPAVTARRGARRVPGLLALAALLAGAAAGWWGAARAHAPRAPLFLPLTFRHGYVSTARFMPDGSSVVYGARWEGAPIQVFSTRLGSPASAALDLPSADVLSVSPTGELALSLGRRFSEFFITNGRLARAPLAGGAPRDLLDDVLEASWTPDGERLLVVRNLEGKCRLELGGKVLYETGGWISDARLSPRGTKVAFLDHDLRGADNGTVALVSASGGGERRALTPELASVWGLAWRGEDEIWFTGVASGWHSTLQAITPQGRSRVVLAVPGRLHLHDIDPAGRVLLAAEHVRVRTLFGTLDDAQERDVSWLDSSFGASLSADGSQVLMVEQGQGTGPRYGIYLRKVDGSPAVRLGDGLGAALSPDGRMLAATTQDSHQLMLLPTGAGEPRTLPGPGLSYQMVDWFPDGRRLVLAALDSRGKARLYTQDVAGGAPQPLSEAGIRLLGALPVSPDGRFVASTGKDGKVYLFPTAGGSPAALAALQPGDFPLRYTTDGRALFAGHAGMDSASILRVDLPAGERRLWKSLRPADPAGIAALWPAGVTPDGRRYAYCYVQALSELFLVEGLR